MELQTESSSSTMSTFMCAIPSLDYFRVCRQVCFVKAKHQVSNAVQRRWKLSISANRQKKRWIDFEKTCFAASGFYSYVAAAELNPDGEKQFPVTSSQAMCGS